MTKDHGLNGLASIQSKIIFFLPHSVEIPLQIKLPPEERLSEFIVQGIKQLQRDADHLPLSSDKEYSEAVIPRLSCITALPSVSLIKARYNFDFTKGNIPFMKRKFILKLM
jgi:hypothetical protein